MQIVIDVPKNLVCEGFERPFTEEEKNILIKAIGNGTPLNRIKAEFIARYPKNYAGELELGGRSCVFSLNQVLTIIDRYRTEGEETDADSN